MQWLKYVRARPHIENSAVEAELSTESNKYKHTIRCKRNDQSTKDRIKAKRRRRIESYDEDTVMHKISNREESLNGV